MRLLKILVFVLAGTTIGCIGPVVVNETARTVGRHNSEIVAGAGQLGGVLKYTFGLAESVDLGLQIESYSAGLRLKYAFVNEREHGFASAIAGGVGSSAGGSHVYADLIASYLFGTMEPYATFRYVRVKTDPQDLRDKDTQQVIYTLPSTNFEYEQIVLGTRVWFNSHWLFSVEAGQLLSISGVFISGAFGYRF